MFIQSPPYRKRPISLTPLIDVVFILLLFFILTSNFIEWRKIDLNLATPATGNADPATLIIRILENDVRLRGESVSMKRLVATVQAELANNADLVLAVQPGANISLQRIVAVLDQLRAAGGRHITLTRLSQFTTR